MGNKKNNNNIFSSVIMEENEILKKEIELLEEELSLERRYSFLKELLLIFLVGVILLGVALMVVPVEIDGVRFTNPKEKLLVILLGTMSPREKKEFTSKLIKLGGKIGKKAIFSIIGK